MFGSYNPYYVQPQMGRMNQYTPPPQQPMYNNPTTSLQGKTVDSLEVVKAMDIPLDGSVSYFPLIDGSAIITKQLQQDGESQTIIFKPVDNTEPPVKYITSDEFKEAMSKLDNSKELQELKDELKSLRRKMRFFVDDKKEE